MTTAKTQVELQAAVHELSAATLVLEKMDQRECEPLRYLVLQALSRIENVLDGETDGKVAP
jgi:hypothetical protein